MILVDIPNGNNNNIFSLSVSMRSFEIRLKPSWRLCSYKSARARTRLSAENRSFFTTKFRIIRIQ